jgi:hypothetical protein
MSLNYATYQEALAKLTAIPSTNADFQAVLPNAIDYAEQRIFRELDMLVEDIRDATSSTTPNVRNFTLPTGLGKFQIVSEVNIITPAGTSASGGTRNPCTPVSSSVLDWTWPSVENAGVPSQFCYFSQSTIAGQPNLIFGPWPDDAYVVEVVGKIIPEPLSATNTETFLTLYLPDLFLMASQIYFDNYMKNFGKLSDDPQSSVTHESQYQALLKSAMDWEARKRFSGASWTAKQIEPTAQPQRG